MIVRHLQDQQKQKIYAKKVGRIYRIISRRGSLLHPQPRLPIRPKKLKGRLFAQSWGRRASASWKRDYLDRKQFKIMQFELVTG